VRCQPRVAESLGIAPGTPLLQIEGTTFDVERRPFEFAQVLYRADRFRFTIESFRRDDRVLNLIGASGRTEGSE
jgi:DNA-binding GntR family transcriptional regulator